MRIEQDIKLDFQDVLLRPKRSTITGVGEISERFWSTIKLSASRRNISIDITLQEIWGLFLKQNRRCALSGVPIWFAPTSRQRSEATASLDRIDSLKPYTLDNVQWVHKDVNRVKQNFSEKDFLKICKQIYEHKISAGYEGTSHAPVKELSYSDIYLLPKKSILHSRTFADTSVSLGDYKFSMPVYPSNMKSVVNEQTCEYLARNHWFYTMHRFGVDNLLFTNRMHDLGLIASISIGISKWSIRDIEILYQSKCQPEFITIDVANAWAPQTRGIIETVREKLPKSYLIVGNAATREAVEEITSWGANAVKVGIGGGHSCTTKNKTGFHRPMVSTIWDCVSETKVPIIADGGISEHGDVAKAIACGATMVMSGYLFSGYDESAGTIIEVDGKQYKEYYGSASEFNKTEKRNIEGKKILVPYKGMMGTLLQQLKEDLQSSISYSGGASLSSLNSSRIITK